MHANDKPLDQFLYENRISPTAEFSARVDAFCGRLRRTDAKTNATRIALRKKQPKRKRALRWIAPVVAVFAVLVLVLSIPSVSQAVSSWFNNVFRLSDYLAVEPDRRENNDDLANAVRMPLPTESSSAIRYLDETEYGEDVDKWRIENGFAAFDRDDYAWVADLNPRVSELLYDGRNLIVNTQLETSPTRFLGTYGGEGERFDLFTSNVSVRIDGEPYTDFLDQGGGLSLQSYFKKDGSDGFDTDAVNAASSVIEQTTLIGKQSPAFPSGPVTVTIEMWLMDGSIDDMGTVGIVAIITQTLTFDATDGNSKLDAAYTVTQQLAGTAPLTVRGEGASLQNRMFDFSSVSVGLSVERRATGVNVTLRYSFPEEDNQTMWDAIVLGAVGLHGVQYEAIVDGTSIGMVWHGSDYLGKRDDPVLEIPLTKSELEAVSSITLRPRVRYVSAYTTDHISYTEMPLDEVVTLNQFGAQYQEVVLENCDIVIPLN